MVKTSFQSWNFELAMFPEKILITKTKFTQLEFNQKMISGIDFSNIYKRPNDEMSGRYPTFSLFFFFRQITSWQ